MPLYELANHRSEEQLREMLRLEQRGVCLFCVADPPSGDGPDAIHSTSRWLVTQNRYPYRGAKHHLLLVPKMHARDLLALPSETLADMWVALAWVRDTFGMDYYGLGARCGDCRYTGGTIEHVHVHVVVGDVDDPRHEPVRLKLSSRPPS